MYKAIFFDLDGTLTESGEGITKSVQYALEKLGVSAPDLEPLKVFVGPPLLEQFYEICRDLIKRQRRRELNITERDIQKKECMRTQFIQAWKTLWQN